VQWIGATVCLKCPVDLPGPSGGAATEGTVFPNMIDIDGSVPDTAQESDAELTARFERDALPLLDQPTSAPCG